MSSIRASTACAAKLSNPAATVGSTTTANLSNHNPGDTTGALALHTVGTDIGKDTGDTARSTPSTRHKLQRPGQTFIKQDICEMITVNEKQQATKMYQTLNHAKILWL